MKKRNILFSIQLVICIMFWITAGFAIYYAAFLFGAIDKSEINNYRTYADILLASGILLEAIGYIVFGILSIVLFFFACYWKVNSNTYLEGQSKKFHKMFKIMFIIFAIWFLLIALVFLFSFTFAQIDYNDKTFQDKPFWDWSQEIVIAFLTSLFIIEIVSWSIVNYAVKQKHWYFNRMLFLVVNLFVIFILIGFMFAYYKQLLDRYELHGKYNDISFMKWSKYSTYCLLKSISLILLGILSLSIFFFLNKKQIIVEYKDIQSKKQITELMAPDFDDKPEVPMIG